MKIHSGLRLSQPEVLSLLNRFDDSSEKPLHEGVDFSTYSIKLSQYAYFIIASENDLQMGFVAYYINYENHFAYVPQVVVHKEARHKGLGHSMFNVLCDSLTSNIKCIKLEVLKSNFYARNFYQREGFSCVEDHSERILLEKKL